MAVSASIFTILYFPISNALFISYLSQSGRLERVKSVCNLLIAIRDSQNRADIARSRIRPFR